jgi:hypothetical protein
MKGMEKGYLKNEGSKGIKGIVGRKNCSEGNV